LKKNDSQIVDKANSVSKRFFEENSEAEKWRHVLRPEAVGYSHFGGKCTRQAFTVNLPKIGQPFPWPEHPDTFQEDITQYFELMQKLGTTILKTISDVLNEIPDVLPSFLDSPSDKNEYSSSVLFIRHYQSEKIGEDLNARTVWPKDHTREHTDSGLLTLKPLSEIAALQIMRWSDSKWIDAEVRTKSTDKLPIIILAGEELAYLTEGYFKAAIHRVAFQDTASSTRVSLPFQLRGNRKKFPKMTNYSSSLKMIAISFH